MRRSSLATVCYLLLVACFPASMVVVVWLSPGAQDWMVKHVPGLQGLMFRYIYPYLPSWPQYFAVQTLTAAIVVCGTAFALGRPGRPAGPRRRGYWVFPALVGAYAASAGLSYFWSAWRYGTRAYFVRELPFYVLCVAAYLLCGRRRRWTTVAWVFAASSFTEAALQGVIIVRQYGSGTVEPPDGRTLSLGYVFLERAIFYSNCNFASALVLTAALITVILLARRLLPAARSEGEKRPSAKQTALLVAATGVVLFVLGFIFLTAGSLAGYVAAAAAGGAYLICMLPARQRLILTGAIVVIGVAGMATVLTSDRLWTLTMRALLSPRRTTHLRVVDWLTAGELYARRPLLGWGMGTFAATHAQYFPPLARKLPFLKDKQTTYPHNEFARVAAEQGSVGLLLYLALIGYAFVVSHRALRTEPLRTRMLGYALWAGGLTFLVQGAFGKAPMNWSFATNFWLLLGVLASAHHWADEPVPAETEDQLRLAPEGWVVLFAVAAAVGWFWWKGQAERFRRFRESVEESRPHFLWPDEMIQADYSAGWFLTDQGQWAAASRQLEQVQRTVPEFQKTRLFLAECYLNMGRTAEAARELAEYMARDPYDLAGYELMARINPDGAVRALEAHVISRLSRPEDWIVEDYPTAEEVQKLLQFYVAMDRMDAARGLVERVRRFFTDELPRPPFDLDKQVRALAQQYREKGRNALAERLRKAVPEAWPHK
jgi:O-antigen ligase